MNIKDIIAVSSVPGLSRLVTSRNNGLILEDLDSGRSRFYSVRKHQFTPLETVAIYTWSDTAELKEILQTMQDKESELPIPHHKENNTVLTNYFTEILPDYDTTRVYVSDIKKIIKWYRKLEEKGLLVAPAPDQDEEE